MSTSRPRRFLVAVVALAACSHSHRVTPPSRPAITRPLVDGPHDGLLVPAPLRLVAAYHDDAGRFAGHVRFGPAVAGRAPAWDDQWIYLVDPATGGITAAVPLADGEDLTAVAVDATGTQLAALRRDGTALHWPTLTAAPTHLTPRLLDAAPIPRPLDAAIDPDAAHLASPALGDDGPSPIDASAGSPPGHLTGFAPYRPDPRGGREDTWALTRAAQRLAFAPDGTRLLAGMHLYALADHRELIPLRPDEIVLDATTDAAIVARLTVAHVEGEPGSQCGFIPTWSRLRLLALDYRTVDAPPIPYPSPVPGLPRDAAVGRREVAFPTAYVRLPPFTSAPIAGAPEPALATTTPPVLDARVADPITAIDIADDGRLAYVAAQRGWLVHDRLATDLRVPDHLDHQPSFRSVTLGPSAIFAVVSHHHRRDTAPTSAYAFDATGAAHVAVPGSTAWVSRSGHSVVTRNGGSTVLWDLGDPRAEPTRTAIDFTATNLRAIDQGRAAARGTRVVLVDSERGHLLYLVRDLATAPPAPRADQHAPGTDHRAPGTDHRAPRTRTLRVPYRNAALWALADDGTTLAVAGEHTVRAFTLDGPALDAPPHRATTPDLTADLPGRVAALATSARIVAAADDRGHVALWRDGHRLDLDLTGRHDRATALAISPDQRLLAVGTGRGRLLVIALDAE